MRCQLSRRHLQAQSNCNPSPQSLQIPIESKCGAERYWHCNDIVTEEINISPNLLPAKSSQKPVAICCQGIKELECGTEGEDTGNKIDNILIVGEKLGDVAAEGGEEDRVEQSDNASSAESLNQISSVLVFWTTLLTTLALVFAASERVAPMRLATRVDAATEMGNGIWNVRAVRVLKIL